MSWPFPMTKKEAERIAGSLSTTSKMPGASYGIPASACKAGSKMAKILGTVCSGCYALNRGNYTYPNVQKAQKFRLNSIDNPSWVDAMVTLIGIQTLIDGEPYFRWHDSGDIQSVEHLEKIVEIAKRLPKVKFWLPTKEAQFLNKYVNKHGKAWPENLTIRWSATKIDQKISPKMAEKYGVNTSSVVSGDKIESCEVNRNKKRFGAKVCGDCRKCWDKNVKDVSYRKH